MAEQFLINPKRKDNYYILERIFAQSVDEARISLKKEWLRDTPERPAVEPSDSESEDDTSGPTVEKQRENLRRQIQHNEKWGTCHFQRERHH